MHLRIWLRGWATPLTAHHLTGHLVTPKLLTLIILDEPIVSISDEDEDDCDGYNLGEDSYCAWDISMWERQGERDKDVTLPAQQEADLDNIIPDVQK